MMKKNKKLIVCIAAVVVAAGYFVFRDHSSAPAGQYAAQGGMPTGDSTQIKKIKKLHPYTYQLVNLISSIERLEEEREYAINPKQAKPMLAVLDSLKSQPTLSEDQASQTITKLESIITDKQRWAIATLPSDSQFHRQAVQVPPMPNAKQRPGGPPAGMAGKAIENSNPFYTQGGGRPGPGGHSRLDKLMDGLKGKS